MVDSVHINSSPLERLVRLTYNAHVRHPDLVQGCIFTIPAPPVGDEVLVLTYPWPRSSWNITNDPAPGWVKGEKVASKYSGPSAIGTHTTDWDTGTGRRLEAIRRTYGDHWSIQFCLDAWNAWQAGEWDAMLSWQGRDAG